MTRQFSTGTKFGSEKEKVQNPARIPPQTPPAGGKKAEAGQFHSPRKIVCPAESELVFRIFVKKSSNFVQKTPPIVGGQMPLFEMEGLKPEGKEPFKIEIKEVPDTDKDGAINIDDVEYLLKHDKNTATPLSGSGDFRSDECIKLLKEADIVVTNPPFSLFREYVEQLIEYNKKFLILGNQNATTYKDIFTLVKENKLWLGYDNGGTKWFQVPDDYDIQTESRIKVEDGVKYFSMGNIAWYTNLDTTKRHEELTLYKKYSPKEYPKYDDYDAINVNRYIDIPMNYDGVMGVPITFVDKYNPEQFEIIGIDRYVEDNPNYGRRFTINGKEIYARILIKNRNIKK